MEKCLSIVLSPDVSNYRKVAQVHWGLTDAQMKGMHVHHHPPVSEGGRNIPEHLYVCSPSMHAHGWHSGEYFIEQAAIGAAKGAAKGGSIGGRKNVENKTGWYSLSPEQCLENSRLGGVRVQELYPDLSKSIGEAHVRNKTGLFSPEHESVMLEWRRKGNRAASKKLSLPVMCVETGKVYASCHEASRETGISNCNIGRAAQGKRKTAGKLHWQLVESPAG